MQAGFLLEENRNPQTGSLAGQLGQIGVSMSLLSDWGSAVLRASAHHLPSYKGEATDWRNHAETHGKRQADRGLLMVGYIVLSKMLFLTNRSRKKYSSNSSALSAG